MNFSEKLKSHLDRTPDKVAVYLQYSHSDDVEISYTRLMHGAASFALAYAEKGIKPGEVIILILQHGEELLYSFWGAILHGAIPSIMPFLTEKLSPDRYRADLTSLLEVTNPSAIVTYSEFESVVKTALHTNDSVRSIMIAELIKNEPFAGLESLQGFERNPEDIVLLQHSSGTTGLQKGVALSHRSVLNQLGTYGEVLNLNEKDMIVSWLPLYHDMGLIAGFIMPILTGVPLVIMSPFDWVRAPYKLFHAITKYKGTLTWLPNFAYNFCVQKTRDRHLDGINLSTLRAIINCSEPVKHGSHMIFYEKFRNYGLQDNTLQTSYAMAENVFCVTQSPLGMDPVLDIVDRDLFTMDHIARPPKDGNPSLTFMSSGRVINNTEVKIVDEKGNDLPQRIVGEIVLRSDCMLKGYYNREDLSSSAFSKGWYKTGDVGYMSDGDLFVSGRKKDMIIVGGRNVYPQDLENLTYEIPGVHSGRAVAFGVFDEIQGTEDAVIVVEVDTKDQDEHQKIAEQIRVHVTKNSAISLRHVKVVESNWIIKTSSGKTSRKANKEKFIQEQKAGK